jgi:hypothetical protein
MTTKESILEELDRIPESELERVLAYVQELVASSRETDDDAFLKVYAALKDKRKEVYQRLADS